MRVSPEAAYALVTNLVNTLANAKPDDSNLPEKLQQIHSDLLAALGADFNMYAMLLDKARGVLAQSKVREKTPIAGAGWVLESRKGGKDEDRIYLVQVAGTKRLVVLNSPVLADPADKRIIVFGGICAGQVEVNDLSPMVVLQGGFIIAPPNNSHWKSERPEHND